MYIRTVLEPNSQADWVQYAFHISFFSLARCIGKVTVSKSTSPKLVKKLMDTGMKPHTVLG